MRIAIFGDSFADDGICWNNRWQDVGFSWIDHLKQNHVVDNFSLGGSCLYYSKKKFDQINLNLYDRVIFVITESIRRYQVIKENSSDDNKNWNWANSLLRIDYYPNDKKYLETIHNFFVYMHNESDEYFHQLMIDDIVRKRTDVILIYYNDLLNISHFEKTFWLDRGFSFDGLVDARKCHLSEENNLILGRAIEDKILYDKNIDFSTLKFVDPTKDFDFYFRKI